MPFAMPSPEVARAKREAEQLRAELAAEKEKAKEAEQARKRAQQLEAELAAERAKAKDAEAQRIKEQQEAKRAQEQVEAKRRAEEQRKAAAQAKAEQKRKAKEKADQETQARRLARERKQSVDEHSPSFPTTSSVNQAELTKFLTHVVKGEQRQAEEMLKKNRHLALASGTVTDHADRTFNNITGFQYAVWALDWHMWSMIQKYLPEEAAQSQAQGFTTGPWVEQHGVQANWQNLLDAYKYYLDNYRELFRTSKWEELHNIWLKQRECSPNCVTAETSQPNI